MYDKYPVYDVPQNNIIQQFFSQRWSAIVIEIAMTIVITVAAGRAFDFFDPFDPTENEAESAALAQPAEAIAPEAGEDVGIPLELVKEQGLAYLRNRQFAAAEAMYGLAIKVAPDDAVNYGMRGYVNMRAQDYEAAGDDFRRLIELEPDDFDGHSALCWSYGELGQFASARRHCERALAQSDSATEYVIALENRCWLFVEMGDYETAKEDCLNVLEALPACRHEVCALAHYNLGRILVTQGELQQALAQFNLATAIGTSYPDMYLEIASVYDTMGYRSAAALHLEKYRALAGGG